MKTCETCGERYQPGNNKQRRCYSCLSRPDVCECGSRISGFDRWGPMWGGECDRAEERASTLLDRLYGSFLKPAHNLPERSETLGKPPYTRRSEGRVSALSTVGAPDNEQER